MEEMHKIDLKSRLILIIAVLMAFYHFYFATIGFITEMTWRAGHLIFASVLILLFKPISKKKSKWLILDGVLILMALVSGFYIIIEYPNMSLRMGAPLPLDIVMGVLSTIVVLEITRRTIGLPLLIIAVIFITYTLFGNFLPGIFGHRGFDFDRIITQIYMTSEGIHGIPIGVMVKYVYFFVLFAGFLEATGAGKWFIDFAFALTGRSRSGPALTAVFSSGLMGSISGSAVANTVATGSFTIPLMKKVGYKPPIAGAIEAASSTGGQMVPPIMGAGAFIIAEWTGIPYRNIIIASIAPAVLYFLSVSFFVHIRALKDGIKKVPVDELPSLKEQLKLGAHYIVAISLLVFMLAYGYSPTYSVCLGIAALIIVSFFKKESRMTFPVFLNALKAAAIIAVPVSAACATAGIVVGVVGLTGLGLKFSAMVISVAGGQKIIAIILVLLASMFLGMGLPVTAAYVVLAVLAVPGLRELGVSALSAHLLVFWYSQDSNITPPVCLAAYAASGIAQSDPMETGLYSWALAKGLYLIPLLFVYTSILTGNVFQIIGISVIAACGLFGMTLFLEGYFVSPLNIISRLMFLTVTICCFWPNQYLNYFGFLMMAVLITYQITMLKLRNRNVAQKIV
ncbi:MAG: TRAP transporter permease [Desulfobacterales bacterium]|nr:TRAP transporter permease [Desulfobacterales bacterium]